MGLFNSFKKKDKSTEDSSANITYSELAHKDDTDLIKLSEVILMETRECITAPNTISIPVASLAGLGGVVSSLIPALRTVTQTTAIDTSGLYRVANMGATDTLKINKKGNNFWGAFKTTDGKSKMAQLEEAGPLSENSSALMPIDPATMMMAVALCSIEQQLGDVLKMEKQILTFLEQDKEAEIEGDLKTLTGILQDYKFNWAQERYINSKHKLVEDIKRTAEQNMIFYQKQIPEDMKEKPMLVGKQTLETTLSSMQKKLKYYRLTLYVYSLASLLEVMLLGNFEKDYIHQVKNTIIKRTDEYCRLYEFSHGYLEKMASSSIEVKVVKGLGVAGKALGNAIGNLSYVKDGKVDEWLIERGEHLQQIGKTMQENPSERLETIHDSGTEMFVRQLDNMNRIYNGTESICFDKDNIYLVAKAG